jgi:uncharacterized membrane protein
LTGDERSALRSVCAAGTTHGGGQGRSLLAVIVDQGRGAGGSMEGKRSFLANTPSSVWLMVLVLLVWIFATGIKLGGLNIPLERIPWSLLVPCCALFCVLHSYIMLGMKRALTLLAMATTISFCFEFVGESTGLIFGPYCYTDVLGPKLFERIPILIPFAWYMMFYPSYVITNLLTEHRPITLKTSVLWITWVSLLGAMVMTAWDLTMDPVMSFHPGAAQPGWCQSATTLQEADVGSPAWVWIDGGVHFGVPLKNFGGWILTAFTVFFSYRLVERKIPMTPLPGWRSRVMGYLPVGVYGGMAIIDTWLGYPEIEDVHLISPFAMGIPFIFASFILFAVRTDLPMWPWHHDAQRGEDSHGA